MRFPLDARLKDGTRIQLLLADQQDREPLARKVRDRPVDVGLRPDVDAVRRLVEDEDARLGGEPLGEHDLLLVAAGQAAHRLRRRRGLDPQLSYGQDTAEAGMIGAFYLKPNWPGRARHVANAGFIVAPQWRNRGLGWLLGALMVDYARDLGYQSVIFNLVFSENVGARYLWKKLGFIELGMIPNAVRKNDGTYQNGIIIFRSL